MRDTFLSGMIIKYSLLKNSYETRTLLECSQIFASLKSKYDFFLSVTIIYISVNMFFATLNNLTLNQKRFPQHLPHIVISFLYLVLIVPCNMQNNIKRVRTK